MASHTSCRGYPNKKWQGIVFFAISIVLLMMLFVELKNFPQKRNISFPKDTTILVGPVNNIYNISTYGEKVDDLKQRARRFGGPSSQGCMSDTGKSYWADRILVDNSHKVVYCYLPKAGSTSWLLILSYLTGKVPIKLTNQTDNDFIAWEPKNLASIGLKFIQNYKKPVSHYKDYFKFMLTRNPYDRVISAYVDKFKNSKDNPYFHNAYGKSIIQKYRKNASADTVNSDNVAFGEFFKYVIDVNKKGGRAPDWHWARATELCGPCSINYTMIARMEEFGDSTKIILEEGFKLAKPIDLPMANRKASSKNMDKLKYYFKDIPRSHIDSFVDLFQSDFDLGGYSTSIPDVYPCNISFYSCLP